MYKLENNVEWTEELKNAFKHGIVKSKLLFNDFEVNESNNLVDVKLTENRYVPDMGFIGQAVARQIEANLTFDLDKQEILENKEFEFKLGAVYNDITYYINYGKFLILDAPENDKTNGKTKIVAYDYMVKFNKEYQDRVTYPCTLKELLLDICSQADVECATEHFVNEDFIVENNQFEGETLRTVLQNIAKCAFTWARIGQDNRLYLDFSINPEHSEILTTDDYKLDGLVVADNSFGPVNQVTYADTSVEGQEERVRDEESISQIGVKELVIYNNLFAYTFEKSQRLIENGTVLFRLNYMPINKIDTIGLVYIDCNDELQVISPTGESYKTLPLNHEIQYTGTTKDSFSSESDTLNEQAYKNTATSVYQNMQTKFVVDKANKKIQSLITEVGDRSEKTTSITQDIDRIESSISSIVTPVDEVSGNTNITLNNCIEGEIIQFKVLGNNTAFGGLMPSNRLTPRNGLVPYGKEAIIKVTSNNYEKEYNLGYLNVLRKKDNTYDELIVENSKVYIIRRINKYGNIMPEEIIEDLGDLKLELKNGTNVISINYNAIIYGKFVIRTEMSDIFATKIEMTSKISQTSNNIMLEVNKKVDENEVGTVIEQNSESVRLAWNNFSEAIKLMIVDGKASLCIVDNNNKIITSFDEDGQHFYNSSENIYGNVGTKKVLSLDAYGEEKQYNYISFFLKTEYDSFIRDGMAWGVETPDNKFYPVMFVRDFYVPKENSGDFSGQVELNNCDLLIGETSGITNNSIKIQGEITGEIKFTSETGYEPQNLITLYPDGHIDTTYPQVKLLDNIIFYRNQAGTNSFRLGSKNNYCLFTDDGNVYNTGDLITHSDIICQGILHVDSDISCQGELHVVEKSHFMDDLDCFGIIHGTVQPFSLKEYKKDIEKYEDSALNEIVKTDIYNYRYMTDTNNSKLRTGAIIGEDYNISEKIVANDESSIDLYSMVSISYKAIQELKEIIDKQQETINDLQNQILEMKGEK